MSCAAYMDNLLTMAKSKTTKILFLTLCKEPFDQIVAGVKREEYREYKPYWMPRLLKDGQPRHFDYVEFRNGYSAEARRMLVKCEGVCVRRDEGEERFVIKLGDVVTAYLGDELSSPSSPSPSTPPRAPVASQPPNIKLARAAIQAAAMQEARMEALTERVAQINQQFSMTDLLLQPLRPVRRRLETDEFVDTNWSEDEKARIARELAEFDRDEVVVNQPVAHQAVARAPKRVRNDDGWFVPACV